jgi:hypothetical protein
MFALAAPEERIRLDLHSLMVRDVRAVQRGQKLGSAAVRARPE